MRCSRRPRRICLPADRRRHRRRARLSRDHRGPPAAHAASPLEAAHQDHADDDRGAPGRRDRVRFRSRVVEPGPSRPAGHRRQAARRLLELGCHLALAPIHDDGDESNRENAEHPPRQVPCGPDGAECEREHPTKPRTHTLPDRAPKFGLVRTKVGVRIDGLGPRSLDQVTVVPPAMRVAATAVAGRVTLARSSSAPAGWLRSLAT